MSGTGSRYFQLLSQYLDPAVRGHLKAANTGNKSNSSDSRIRESSLVIGIVIRSGPGTFDAQVKIGSQNPITCLQLCGLNGYSSGFGYTSSQLLQEGTPVLVYKPQTFSDFGLIISALPLMYAGQRENEKAQVQMVDAEPGVASFTEQAYREPMEDQNDIGIINSNSGRCLDIFPGEIAQFNELGVGYALLHMAMRLRATERAKLEFFYLDDLVRMVSGQFQHFSAIGEEQIYNDYGYVTRELSGSCHQCEVLGLDKYGKALATKSSADLTEAKQCDLQSAEDEMVPHRRFHSFLGHLAGGFQFYMLTPGPEHEGKISTPGGGPDRGLAQIAVEDNGRVVVRSVSDIILQRTNLIAVPRKAKEPWDPEGDRMEEAGTPEGKKPFKWGEPDKPLSHPLQQRDYFAWARKMLYLRFWEQSTENGKKDWVLVEESDTPELKDNYDTVINNNDDYTLWEERSTTVMLGKDGTFTVRNDEGSEISLAGKDIIITCPGQIQLRSGESTVMLAGDDLVAKAKNSVDITATDHDVRIKAEKNLHQYSGRSIMLEAGEPDTADPPSEGEDALAMAGILLKSDKHKVSLWGHSICLHTLSDVIIEGVRNVASKLVIAMHKLVAVTRQASIVSVPGTEGAKKPSSGLFLHDGNARLFGSTAYLVGDKAAAVMRDNQFGVFLKWQDMEGTNPNTALTNAASVWKEQYFSSDEWTAEASEDRRKAYVFTHRNDMQYNTGAPFEVYESHWAYVARKTSGVSSWSEHAIHDTYPWPGKRAYTETAVFQQLEEEVNITDVKTGKPVGFNERKDTGAGFKAAKFSEYGG